MIFSERNNEKMAVSFDHIESFFIIDANAQKCSTAVYRKAESRIHHIHLF
jgi:hypothetical protein